MTSPDMIKLVQWYRETFAARTKSVADGAARIDWIDPGTRVSFSEIAAKASEIGITLNPVELRSAIAALDE